MGVEHYENFPVASLLLPKAMRHPVTVIYRFARTADDFADEGELSPAERLALLDGYRQQLFAIAAGQPASSPLFADLAQVVAQYGLPWQLLHDLLDAFSQDVCKTRYANFAELLDYCRRSANPVGRLLLQLQGIRDPQLLAMSDHICSSLQLINFWQDVAIDWKKDRVYIPQEDLQRFGVSEAQIAAGDSGGAWAELLGFEVERAGAMLQAGAPLARQLPGRFGLEIRMTVQGGATIVRKLRAQPDVFRRRPVLGAGDWPWMLARAVLKR